MTAAACELPTGVLACATAPLEHRPRRPLWQAARFLTRRQLRGLGACHGRVRLHGTLIMSGAVPGSWHAGPFLEALRRRACPAVGAFQVPTVEKTA